MLPIKVTAQNYKHWFAFGWQFLTRQFQSTFNAEKELKQRFLDRVKENSQQNDPDSVLAAINDFARSDRFMMNVGENNVGIFENSLKDYLSYVREFGKYKSTFYKTSMESNNSIEDGVEVSILLN